MPPVDRRTVLASGLALAGNSILPGCVSHAGAQASGSPPKPLSILILGGTGFTGPHQVRYALSRGHKVTLFNRGRRRRSGPRPWRS
jgi:2'-hydroxyisoflavone reductase